MIENIICFIIQFFILLVIVLSLYSDDDVFNIYNVYNVTFTVDIYVYISHRMQNAKSVLNY